VSLSWVLVPPFLLNCLEMWSGADGITIGCSYEVDNAHL
jgi:hypothetical protein